MVIVAGILGYSLFLQADKLPRESLVRTFVVNELAEDKLGVSMNRIIRTALNDTTVLIEIEGRVVLTEDMYQPVNVRNYLHTHFSGSVQELEAVARLLRSGHAPRILELLQLKAPSPDVAKIQLLQRVAEAGSTYAFKAIIEANRSSGAWEFVWTEMNEPKDFPEGMYRAEFNPDAWVVSDTNDRQRLEQWIESYSIIAASWERGQGMFDQELQLLRQQRLTQFLEWIRAGALYRGQVTGALDRFTHDVILQIDTVEADGKRVIASMRQEGGWSDFRVWSGVVLTRDDAAEVSLLLQSPAQNRLQGAGSLIGMNASLEFLLKQSDNQWVSANNRWRVELSQLSPEEAADLKDRLQEPAKALSELFAKDSIFTGEVLATEGMQRNAVSLEVTQLLIDGTVVMRLSDREHPAWSRQIKATLDANHLRNSGKPLTLRLDGTDFVPGSPQNSLFATRRSLTLTLGTNVGDGLIFGDSGGFTVSLRKLDVDAAAELRADRVRQREKYLELLQSGKAYNGLAVSADRTRTTPVRLRVHSQDVEKGTLVVSLAALSKVSNYRVFAARLQPETGMLVLRTNVAPHSMGATDPFFSATRLDRVREMEISFGVSDNAMIADMNGWRVNLDTSKPLPHLPGIIPVGTHAISDAGFQVLPVNGGRVRYGAAEVITGALSGILGVRRPDNQRQGALVFDGSAPLPVLKGNDLHFIYHGAINLPRGLPSHIPHVVVAPSRGLENGNREAPLVEIAPGILFFQDSTFQGWIELIADNTYWVTIPETLPAGTYIFAAGNTGLAEFKVE
ncbi:MAG: hypothetical protein LR015_02895 [Verrucomicrobia bacterium]|nr:hypothetical protein [Verrucomicrobiota bacterium]